MRRLRRLISVLSVMLLAVLARMVTSGLTMTLGATAIVIALLLLVGLALYRRGHALDPGHHPRGAARGRRSGA